MTKPLAKPQGKIPVGWVTIAGQRLPVVIEMEWDSYLFTLTERAGGTAGSGTFEEYLPALLGAAASSPEAHEALRAVDELRNELASTRAELQGLRGLIDDLEAQMSALRCVDDLRAQVEQIEDRLQ